MTDLTDEEQARVRTAIRFLGRRVGGPRTLAKALGFSPHTLRHVRKGEKNVSASMTVRIARLAAVTVDALLAGRYPPTGTCPHCGHATDSAGVTAQSD